MIGAAALLALAVMAGPSVAPAAPGTLSEFEALLPYLSATERAELDRLLPLWLPNPPKDPRGVNPQRLALFSEADELYYGGAAGGGKTDLLLGAALTQHRKAIVFRRELSQLNDAIERIHAIGGRFGRYNGQTHVYKLRRPGEPLRSVEFGGVQYEEDKQKYRGRPHDLKAFDEIPEFSKTQYLFLNAWNRTTVPGQRCRTICCGNPPSHSDGLWVIEHWAPWLREGHPNPALPGELRWYAVIRGEEIEVPGPEPIADGSELVYPRSRTFIPAHLDDNPSLVRTGYRRNLQGLPEPLRSQLLFGDFKAGLEDHAYQVIPTAWIRASMERWKTGPRPPIRQTHVGVDVARGGKDRTAIAPRYAWWFEKLHAFDGAVTRTGPEVAAKVLPFLSEGGFAAIDADGVGASPYDSLRQAEARVVPVRFSMGAPQGATDRSGLLQFVNLRAFAYWTLRDALDPDPERNPEPIALPDDPELFGDLTAPHFEVRNGRILIEDKERIRQRLGRSPDKGDAVAVTFVANEPALLTEESIVVGESELGDFDSPSWSEE